jgi:dihydroflavonol-4-reductase
LEQPRRPNAWRPTPADWNRSSAKSLRLPLPCNLRLVPYATRYFWVDASKARRELGVDFRGARETLAPTVSWLKSAGLIN